MSSVDGELEQLVEGALDLKQFPHREHVRLGYEMLQRHDFAEAAFLFSRGLRKLTKKVGRAEKYHETLTIGFLAVIAERSAAAPEQGWESFIADNPDLLDKQCLQRWYGEARLSSEAARKTFILPLPPEAG